MDLKIILSYQLASKKSDELEEHTFRQAKINHIRSLPSLKRTGKPKLGNKHPTQEQAPAFGVTAIAFLWGDRLITTHAKLNPNDHSYSKRAGILSAMVNFVTRSFPAKNHEEVLLVEANRVSNDTFDGYELEFMSTDEAIANGWFIEDYWWLKSKVCPNQFQEDSQEERIQTAIKEGKALRQQRETADITT